MKFVINSFLFLILIFLHSCSSKEKKARETLRGSEELSVYSTDKHGFSTNYPKGWDTTITHPKALFVARETEDDDEFYESLNVIKTRMQIEPTLEQLKDYAANELMTTYPGSVIYSEAIEKTSGGDDYVLMEMNIEAQNKEYITMTAFYPNGKDLYMLTMMGSKDDFYDYQILFKTIACEFSYDK